MLADLIHQRRVSGADSGHAVEAIHAALSTAIVQWDDLGLGRLPDPLAEE